jgi:hypothetical protein
VKAKRKKNDGGNAEEIKISSLKNLALKAISFIETAMTKIEEHDDSIEILASELKRLADRSC